MAAVREYATDRCEITREPAAEYWPRIYAEAETDDGLDLDTDAEKLGVDPVTATVDYTDLLSHSGAVEEIHALAGILARVVTVIRESDVVLPPELSPLVELATARTSVARRLGDAREASSHPGNDGTAR